MKKAIVVVTHAHDAEANQSWLEQLSGSFDLLLALPKKHAFDPGRIAVLQSESQDLEPLIRAYAKRSEKNDLIIVRYGVDLPLSWFERLSGAVQARLSPALICPCSDEHAALLPWFGNISPDQSWTSAAIDELVYLCGAQRLHSTTHLSSHLCFVPAEVLQQVNRRPGVDLDRLLESASIPKLVSDNLYVASGESIAPQASSSNTPGYDGLAALRLKVTPYLQKKCVIAACRPGLDDKPVVLHISHSWGGGVARWVQDFIAADDEKHHLLLSSCGDWKTRTYGIDLTLSAGSGDVILENWTDINDINSVSFGSENYKAVLAYIVQRFHVDQIIVSSLVGHSFDVFDAGPPVLWVLHDYFPFCAALNTYFDKVCTSCTSKELANCLSSNPLAQTFSHASAEEWVALRSKLAAMVQAKAVTLVAPNQFVARQYKQLFPVLSERPIQVIPHGLPAEICAQNRQLVSPNKSGKLQVLVLGNMNDAKGIDLLQSALDQLLVFSDIHLLGCGKQATAFFGRSGVNIISQYDRNSLGRHLAEINPHCALLLSRVPETFSYTLSELQYFCIPTVGVNRGSIGERIIAGENGWLIDDSVQSLCDRLAQLNAEPEQLAQMVQRLSVIAPASAATMVQAYNQILAIRKPETFRCETSLSDHNTIASNLSAHNLHKSEQQVLNLDKEIATLETETQARATWARKLEKQLNERTEWTTKLRAEITGFEMAVEQRQQDIVEQKKWIGLLKKETRDLKQLLSETSERMEGAIKQLVSAQTEAEKLVTQKFELEKVLDERGAELRLILDSSSWKLTRPLRVARRLLSNGKASLLFQFLRIRNLIRRTAASLSSRGFRPTLRRGLHYFRGTAQQEPPKKAQLTDETLAFASPAQPTVSIIIPVYNQFQYTYACLKSLANCHTDCTFEVILVDDCSSDETAQMLAGIEGIVVESNKINLGFVGSCNNGAKLASAEYLIFLNNDTTLSDGWVDALVQTFTDFPKCGLAGAKLVYPDGRLQEAGGIIFSDGSGWNYGRLENPQDGKYSYAREVDYCSGAAIILRRDLFEKLGGFDGRYAPAYYEDTDLAFQVREQGLEVIYQPASVVTHYEGVSCGTDLSQGLKQYQVRNQGRFLQRWQIRLADHPENGSNIELAKEHRVAKRALIVDACTPMPDQDSGSVRMANLIKILQDLGFKVSFLAENLAHHGDYTSALQATGVEMIYAPSVRSPNDFFSKRGAEFDLIILSRHYVASQFLPLVQQYCDQAMVLFDTVDLHYLRETRQAELLDSQKIMRQAAKTKKAELAVARQCDVTLVVSTIEKEQLALEIPECRVEILSNIHAIHGARQPFKTRKDILFVGGFQHPPNQDAILYFVKQVLPSVLAQIPELCLHIIGSKTPDEILALDGECIKVHGFVENLEPYLDGCKMAIAPLRYGAGVKGKVNMSMSYGQPVVCTPVAVEGMFASHETDVLVADNAEDFARQVVRLYTDEALWSKLSKNAVKNVEKHFSFAAAHSAIENVLKVKQS